MTSRAALLFSGLLMMLMASYQAPVRAFFNASGRGAHAQAALQEIVKTMSGRIIDEACLTLPFIGKHVGQEQLETDPNLATLIRSTIQTYVNRLNR